MRKLAVSLAVLAASCHFVVACAGKREEGAAIRYSQEKVVNSRPYEVSLAYPKFEGEPAGTVAKLNAWVQRQIFACPGDESTSEHSYVTQELAVRRLGKSVVVLEDRYDTNCDGAAHPNHGSRDYFIDLGTGSEVDLWGLLPEQGQSAILRHLMDAGKSMPADDECKEVFSQESLQDGFAYFVYRDRDSVTVRPSFPHVVQACESAVDVPITISELKKLYSPHSPAQLILDDIAQITNRHEKSFNKRSKMFNLSLWTSLPRHLPVE